MQTRHDFQTGHRHFSTIYYSYLLSIILISLPSAASDTKRLKEPRISQPAFARLLAACAPNVHPLTMSSVTGVESNRYPLRIHINSKLQLKHQPYTLEQAIDSAIWLERNGFSFDVGMGQVNNVNVRKYRLSWRQAFDPCTNLFVASEILLSNFAAERPANRNDQAAIKRALSRYNTGSPVRGFSNGYVQKIEAEAGRLLNAQKD